MPLEAETVDVHKGRFRGPLLISVDWRHVRHRFFQLAIDFRSVGTDQMVMPDCSRSCFNFAGRLGVATAMPGFGHLLA